MVTGVPSAPRFLPSIFIAHRVQQSHCSSIFHRVLLTHALALSACQIEHKKESPRTYTSLHSGGFELTKLTYTRLEDNLIRYRGDLIMILRVPKGTYVLTALALLEQQQFNTLHVLRARTAMKKKHAQKHTHYYLPGIILVPTEQFEIVLSCASSCHALRHEAPRKMQLGQGRFCCVYTRYYFYNIGHRHNR